MFMFFGDQTIDHDTLQAERAAQRDADSEFFVAALKEMITIGVDIGRTIRELVVAQAIDSPHTIDADGCSRAYERVCRALRRSVMLAHKINHPEPTRTCSDPGNVGEANRNPRPTPPNQERLCTDRQDRPDAPEELEDKPTLEIINDIRKDLNLPPLPPGEGRGEGPTTNTTPNHLPLSPRERAGVRVQPPPPLPPGEGRGEGRPPYPPGT